MYCTEPFFEISYGDTGSNPPKILQTGTLKLSIFCANFGKLEFGEIWEVNTKFELLELKLTDINLQLFASNIC